MTTKQVAERLVSLCRAGKTRQAQMELLSDNVANVEPPKAQAESVTGREAVIRKGDAFAAMVEKEHGRNITDPIIAGNHFTIGYSLDVTMKEKGRMKLEELCLYEVQDGKIVREEFFV